MQELKTFWFWSAASMAGNLLADLFVAAPAFPARVRLSVLNALLKGHTGWEASTLFCPSPLSLYAIYLCNATNKRLY